MGVASSAPRRSRSVGSASSNGWLCNPKPRGAPGCSLPSLGSEGCSAAMKRVVSPGALPTRALGSGPGQPPKKGALRAVVLRARARRPGEGVKPAEGRGGAPGCVRQEPPERGTMRWWTPARDRAGRRHRAPSCPLRFSGFLSGGVRCSRFAVIMRTACPPMFLSANWPLTPTLTQAYSPRQASLPASAPLFWLRLHRRRSCQNHQTRMGRRLGGSGEAA